MPRTAPLLSLAACAALALAGCATRGTGRIDDGVPYPASKVQGATLDVQVFRDGTDIRFTNTSAAPLGPGRLWLNAWYSRELPPVGVGETIELGLRAFRDRYGQPFRAGGFWAVDPAAPVVLAQVEEQDRLVGLVVVTPPR